MSTTALTAPVQTGAPAPTPTSVALAPRRVGLLRPIAPPAQVLAAAEETRALVAEALKDGRDYGVIPGTDRGQEKKERKVLLKAGAERVAIAFGCYYGDPEIVEKEADHDRVVEYVKRKKRWEKQGGKNKMVGWDEERGTVIGLYRYVLRVPVIHAESGSVVGYGVGSCSTLEGKYVDRPRESENTVIKMAHKRAIVAAALIAFGLSDQFTQDVEEVATAQTAGAAAAVVAIDEDDAGDAAEPTLDIALGYKINGKLLSEMSRRTLQTAEQYFDKKLETSPDDESFAYAYKCVQLVLEHRESEAAREAELKGRGFRPEQKDAVVGTIAPDPAAGAATAPAGPIQPAQSSTTSAGSGGTASPSQSSTTTSSGSTTPEPTVAQLDHAAQTAAAEEAMKADPNSVWSLTMKLNALLDEEWVTPIKRKDIKARLINGELGTAEKLLHAIQRVERDKDIPF